MSVTYSQRMSFCGKPRCRKCREGIGHGPYWYAYQTVNGHTTRTYLGKTLPPEVQASLETFTPDMNEVASPSTSPISPLTSVPAATLPSPDAASAMLRIISLGQFHLERSSNQQWQTITDSAWQQQQIRALLAYLICCPERKASRSQIITALWPSSDIETATNRLNKTVQNLRKVLGYPSIESASTGDISCASSTLANVKLLPLYIEDEGIRLAGQDLILIDADAFETSLAHIYTLPTATSDSRENLLREAMALYGGDFIPEERSAPWVIARRQALQRSWSELLLNLADLSIARQAMPAAIDVLDRLVANDPTNEPAVQRLIVALAAIKRRGEALRAYNRFVEVLQGTYQAMPSQETRSLYETVRQGGNLDDWLRTRFTPAASAFAPSVTHLPGAPYAAPEPDNASSSESTLPPHTGAEQQRTIPLETIGRTHQSALVGRAAELATMRAMLLHVEQHTCSRSQPVGQHRVPGLSLGTQHSPQGLVLAGDAGIGKTRLAEEVSREARQRAWTVVWSRVYVQESNIPYRLWTEVLRRAMEQEVMQPERLSKQPQIFQPLSILLPELHHLLPQVPYSSSLPPEQEQLRIWEAVCEALIMISEGTPLLITLDDLQWADASSCALLAYLVRRIQGLPIVIISTCRDNELVSTHSLRSLLTDLQKERAIETIQLSPLSDEQIVSLISQVPHLPEPIVERIRTRAAGNPFFAEELARTIGTQLSTSDTSGKMSVEERENTPMPESITAIFDVRLTGLSQPCQRLLSKAAILGGSFRYRVIMAMEATTPDSNEDITLDLLEEALRSGMLTEEGMGTHITYHFWHPLLESHLYERLSAARRASLHRRAAEVLSHLYQDQVEEAAATIVHHLIKGGADPSTIAHYAEMAGNHSYQLSSYTEAEQHYQMALEYTEAHAKPITEIGADEQAHLAYLLEVLAECMVVRGKQNEARHLYERILTLRSQQRNVSSQAASAYEIQFDALLWIEIGKAWYNVGNNAQAKQCYQRSEQILRETGIIAGAAWASLRHQQSRVSWREGAYEQARRTALEALTLFENALKQQRQDTDTAPRSTRIKRTLAGDPVDLGRIHMLLSSIEAACGGYKNSLSHLNIALTIFEQYECLREIAIVCCNLGDRYLKTADYSQAQAVLRRALNLAERVGELPLVSFVLGNLGVLDIRTGNLIEAEAKMRQTITQVERLDDPVDVSILSSYLASALLEQGKLSEAKGILHRALTIGRAQRVVPCIGLALIVSGHMRIMHAMTLENDTKAHEEKMRALQRARNSLQRVIALESIEAETKTEGRLALAEAVLLLGESQLAHQVAVQALEEARQFELNWLVARAQRVLGCVSAAQGQQAQADQYFRQAERTFRYNGMHLEYGRTLQQYGTVLFQRGGGEGEEHQLGLSYLQKARQVFTTCKAELDLQMVECTLARYRKQQ